MRGYGASLEPLPPGVTGRGTSKSAASRQLVKRMGGKMKHYPSRSLEEIKLLALLLDGVEVGGHTVVVALGITGDGTKLPPVPCLGQTVYASVCTSLLDDLT